MKFDSRKSKETTKSTKTVQLRRIDLNLFWVFDAILQHGSVTRAAQALSITPSAVSHALSRLRQMIGDELFVPSSLGMEPTRHARELALAVQEGLENFQLALTAKPFVPAEADRCFRTAPSDGVTAPLLPPSFPPLVTHAPPA